MINDRKNRENSRFLVCSGCSGKVALRVVICAASLFLVGAAIAVSLRTFERDKSEDYRRALATSEYGLQAAFERIAESPDWSEGFDREPYEDGSFSVTIERETRDGAVYIKLKSTGFVGSASQTKEFSLRLERPELEQSESDTDQLFSAERD